MSVLLAATCCHFNWTSETNGYRTPWTCQYQNSILMVVHAAMCSSWEQWQTTYCLSVCIVYAKVWSRKLRAVFMPTLLNHMIHMHFFASCSSSWRIWGFQETFTGLDMGKWWLLAAASSSRPIHPVSRLPLSSKHSITALQKTILADLQPWFSKSETWNSTWHVKTSDSVKTCENQTGFHIVSAPAERCRSLPYITTYYIHPVRKLIAWRHQNRSSLRFPASKIPGKSKNSKPGASPLLHGICRNL